MKPSHLVLLAAAVLAAGAASWLGRGGRGAQASPALEPIGSPRDAGQTSTLPGRLDRPGDAIAPLGGEARTPGVADRRAVDPPPGAPDADAEPAPSTASPATGPERAAEEERHELEMLRDRAEHIARRVGLDDDEERSLAGLLFEQRDRRLALVAEMRARPPSRTRDAELRESVLELREWLHRELALRLGAARAQEVRSAFEDPGLGRTSSDEGE